MGFDARVEPFLFSTEKTRKELGFFKYRREKSRVIRAVETIRRAIDQNLTTEFPWARLDGERVCNMRIAKLGVLQDLKDYAAKLDNTTLQQIKKEGAPTRFLHLVQTSEQHGYILPENFPKPLLIQLRDVRGPFPVLSSYRLQAELSEINKSLNVEKTFKIKKMPQFMEAKDEDIAHFEANFNVRGDFWIKFGFLVITKLTEQSIEHKLPVSFW